MVRCNGGCGQGRYPACNNSGIEKILHSDFGLGFLTGTTERQTFCLRIQVINATCSVPSVNLL